MEGNNWIKIISEQNQVSKIVETNQVTEKFGLVLTEEDAKILVLEKQASLNEQRRIEYGESILPKIIYEFCDSDYISQKNYVETIGRIQDIFFLYKNEMMDEISDDELLHFMKEQFETVCYGDLDYLEGTCLDIFAQAIRAGYQGYRVTDGKNEFGRFDLVQRWDHEVYMEVLRELCWR